MNQRLFETLTTQGDPALRIVNLIDALQRRVAELERAHNTLAARFDRTHPLLVDGEPLDGGNPSVIALVRDVRSFLRVHAEFCDADLRTYASCVGEYIDALEKSVKPFEGVL